MSECKTCGEEVVWLKTHKGKSVMCDPPASSGEIYDKDKHACHWDHCEKGVSSGGGGTSQPSVSKADFDLLVTIVKEIGTMVDALCKDSGIEIEKKDVPF